MLGEARLPPAYSVFGVVTEGDEVLDRIAALPLGDRFTGSGVETSVPLETVYLERVTVDVG
jgi:cyclophilin family peptidyl-prolyl cis-trans isomerase